MFGRKILRPNDVTNRYVTELIPEALHHYLKLPGRFVRNYPTKIVRRDGSEGDMDWLMLVEADNDTLSQNILINVEFQTRKVTKEKIKIIADYRDYAKTYYGLPVLSIIVITSEFEKSAKEYSIVASDILKPVYIFKDENEIMERLNNFEDKIINHIPLNSDEALDVIYLPMFASHENAREITEKVTRLFNKDKSVTKIFRNHIGFGLSIMIKKYFSTQEAKELLKMLEYEIENDRLRPVVDFEVDYIRRSYEEELLQKDKSLEEQNKLLKEKDKSLNEKDKSLEEQNKLLKEKDKSLNEKDKEVEFLKSKLRDNNISY